MVNRKKKKPKDNFPSSATNLQGITKTEVKAQFASYQGPLPPSKEMEGYQNIDSSFPDRIITMAEIEQKHRHTIETDTLLVQKSIVKNDFYEKRIGQVFAFIVALTVVGCGTYLTLQGYQIAGTILSGGCLVSLVTAFIAGRVIKDDEKPE